MGPSCLKLPCAARPGPETPPPLLPLLLAVLLQVNQALLKGGCCPGCPHSTTPDPACRSPVSRRQLACPQRASCCFPTASCPPLHCFPMPSGPRVLGMLVSRVVFFLFQRLKTVYPSPHPALHPPPPCPNEFQCNAMPLLSLLPFHHLSRGRRPAAPDLPVSLPAPPPPTGQQGGRHLRAGTGASLL